MKKVYIITMHSNKVMLVFSDLESAIGNLKNAGYKVLDFIEGKATFYKIDNLYNKYTSLNCGTLIEREVVA